MENKPMAGWRVVLLVWAVAGLTYPSAKGFMGDTGASFLFLALLIATSTYLYSKRFAGFINRLLDRWNLIA
jgi:hypothetical protein